VTLIPSIDRNASLSIILSDLPDSGDTAVNFRRALLVQEIGMVTAKSLESSEERNITHVKFLALLRVYSVSGGDNSTSDIQACWINNGSEQLWCIG
jgi:hypothetical protein